MLLGKHRKGEDIREMDQGSRRTNLLKRILNQYSFCWLNKETGLPEELTCLSQKVHQIRQHKKIPRLN